MNKLFLLALALSSSLLMSCKDKSQVIHPSNEKEIKLSKESLSEGFQLVESNCFSCHSPNASIENRIAPPMEAIKKHYITEDVSQEQFVNDLLSFLHDPTIEKSKMPNAVKRFNLMPKMDFSDTQIQNIAAYIYQTELEKPDWFEEHYQAEKLKHGKMQDNAFKNPLEIGQNMAMKTKAVLGKNLLQAINSEGTEHALSFCSTKAIPLTDSMSTELNSIIKRVSDKNRNPHNAADQDELAYIQKTKLMIEKGEKPEPTIIEKGDKYHAYYPIMTNQMCLQCHGQLEKNILPSTMNKIAELYPDDKATGYNENELRGIWVVEMDQ